MSDDSKPDVLIRDDGAAALGAFNAPPRWVLLLRSSVFALGYAITVVLFAVPAVFTYPLPFRWRYRFVSQWARFNIWWLRVSCGLAFEVEGKERIPAEAAVIFCKHQSAWETLALQLIFPPQIWLLKRELLWIPFFGWGLAVLDPIAIDRRQKRNALKSLLQQGKQRLQTGRWVVIFPEGTRVPPGAHRPFQLGGAKLAEYAGVPVVPVAHNAGYFWPRRSFLKYPGTIRICIGPRIPTAGRKTAEINADAEAWIREHSARLARDPYATDARHDG